MTDMRDWIRELASDSPAPGGGGAAALTGACAAALGGMVANLTYGNPKYASVRDDMGAFAARASELSEHMFNLIEEDREAFLPLAAAYRIPKDDPDRPSKLEFALRTAAGAPMEMLKTASAIPELLNELLAKGSRLALSDVGCASELCASCAKTAYINVLVNTGLMKDRDFAGRMEEEAESLLDGILSACDGLSASVLRTLKK